MEWQVVSLSAASPLILTFSPLRGEGTGCGQALILESFTNFIRFRILMHEFFGFEANGSSGFGLKIEDIFKARPHPGLLPQGEGKARGHFWIGGESFRSTQPAIVQGFKARMVFGIFFLNP
jgi:hypothetical protein